jgi:GNAT superfamily N-acetyltransferase
MLRDAAAGTFPAFDGRVEVFRSPGPPADALVGFTGHFVLAADIDPEEVAGRWRPGDLRGPFSPDGLVWLEERLGRRSLTHDALLVAFGDGTGAPPWLRRDDAFAHARVDEASHFRAVESVWTDEVGSVVVIGRGLCGRWEVGYEVEPAHRGAGVGRRLVSAARSLVPAGEPLWAQVAPGNVASMRSTLAAGFVPVGAEMLFVPSR